MYVSLIEATEYTSVIRNSISLRDWYIPSWTDMVYYWYATDILSIYIYYLYPKLDRPIRFFRSIFLASWMADKIVDRKVTRASQLSTISRDIFTRTRN